MKPSPQITTDLFNQELDREYCDQLSFMVKLAHIFGLALIIGGLLVLKDLPMRPHTILTIVLVGAGTVALFLFHFYCWHDTTRTRLAKAFNLDSPFPTPEAIRKTRILLATLILILVDSLILIVLIPLTGGPGKSVLDPLVPTIPIIPSF